MNLPTQLNSSKIC